MATYKVWIHVEKVDEKRDLYADLSDPVEVADVATCAEAVNIVNYLAEAAEKY
jgi:hypothetical protein